MGWQLIQSYNVGDNITAAPAASVTFSSIPQTYKALKVVASARSDQGAVGSALELRINGLTTNIYSLRRVRGNGSATNSYSESNSPSLSQYAVIPGTSATSSTFSNVAIDIPNYTSTSANKPLSVDGVGENNATEAYADLTAGIVATTNAVTSVTLINGGFNFTFGSTFTLYGLI